MTVANVLATVTGADGFETIYVDMTSVIAAAGALTGTPTVETEHTDKIAISGAAITFSGSLTYINSAGNTVTTTFAAGEILSFVVTAQQETGGVVPIDITYETAKRKETVRVAVRMAKWST